jgi:carbamoyl-phosphate synthase large subunit
MTNKPITVLVTGVGAIIGYGLINSLKKSNYDCRVIGIDIFHDAVGQKWCDKFIQGVRADSEEFIVFINNIIKTEKVDLVIPGIEQDLKALIEGYENLDHSAQYSLNNKSLYKTFDDKKLTYKFLEGTADLIPYIDYTNTLYEEAKNTFGLPFILKQDVSYASKGVALIQDEKDFNFYIERFGAGCMAQKKLDITDKEYTCSLFGVGDGTFVNPTCLRRELSQEGATKKALNVKVDDTLLATMTKICQKCNFEGPTNLQFIEFEGKYLLLEINGRVSSSTSMRELFGVNEAEMCIDHYLMNQKPKTKQQKYGTIMRYIGDAYFDSDTL